MFEHLKKFDRIVVTGPHRSGTTICAEMIAADTGFEAVREERFSCRNEGLFRRFMKRAKRVVVQAPAMFWTLPDVDDGRTAFVLMRRPLDELHASKRYPPGREVPLKPYPESGDAPESKYKAWDRMELSNKIEINYSDLALHRLWVPTEKRRALGPKWHHRRTRL